MKKLTFLIFIFPLFLNTSCNNDDECIDCTPYIPSTFSCYINGEYWEAEYPPVLITNGEKNIGIGYQKSTGYFSLRAVKKTLDENISNERLILRAWEQENGSFSFDPQFTLYRDFNDTTCFEYSLDTLKNLSLNLTEIDTETSRMKGDFEMTLIETECLDTIRITNAVFDSQFTGD